METSIREIMPRYSGKKFPRFKISDAGDVYPIVKKLVKYPDKEHMLAVYLNGAHETIGYSIISIGGLRSAPVHAREVFRPAVVTASAAVILAHNHPSGAIDPSEADIRTTRELIQAGKILGIKILDHLVFNDKSYTSIREQQQTAVSSLSFD